MNDKHILLGKNGKGGVYQDLWVIPGGGIDDGETKLAALKREVLEEVGLDISKAKIEPIDKVMSGEAEKTFKETGETMHVEMTFYNFRVNIDKSAKELPISLNDDLGEAVWTPFNQLADKKYSPSVEATLRFLGLLP